MVGRRLSLRTHGLLAVACAAGALSFLGPLRDERRLHRADRALLSGHPAEAILLTDGLDERGVRARAERLRAVAALQVGDLLEAERALVRAVQAEPNSWSLRLDHAVVLRRLQAQGAARKEFERALALNPRLDVPAGFSPGRVRPG